MLGNIRRGAEERKEARIKPSHLQKKVGFAGMNGALIIHPGTPVRVGNCRVEV